MAQVGIRTRADRSIVVRQKQEKIYETMVENNVDRFKTEQKALWENRMGDVVRANRVQQKVEELKGQSMSTLQDRRKKLAMQLAQEQAAYEQEMVDREETAQQRMDKMAVRAYEMKKRREDERKQVVQDKLYQQWRAGIDDLRTQDSKLVEIQTIVARDDQLMEKEEAKRRDAEEKQMWDHLWMEGYGAKVEREEREKALKHERNEVQKRTLGMQLDVKARKEGEAKKVEDEERGQMIRLWAAQEVEAKEKTEREKIFAREERKKMDEFAAIQNAQKAEESKAERDADYNFVQGVLAREKALDEQEAAEKVKARKKAVEFTEALKLEMARKAESEEKLLQLQREESERQWQKKYARWEQEELARRKLMTEVYEGRAEQVGLKQQLREELKEQVRADRELIDAECQRLEAVEHEKDAAEVMVRKVTQEELFRQMDYHAAQKRKEQEQYAREQQEVAAQEDKLQRALAAERAKAAELQAGVQAQRKTKRTPMSAPFATDE